MISKPRLEAASKPAKEVVVKKTRRVDSNRIRKLAQLIKYESWQHVYDGNTASGMTENLIELLTEKLNEICPEEEVKISQFEGKITSLALQKLVRMKKREFEKHIWRLRQNGCHSVNSKTELCIILVILLTVNRMDHCFDAILLFSNHKRTETE